jgi:hypothetical protein
MPSSAVSMILDLNLTCRTRSTRRTRPIEA